MKQRDDGSGEIYEMMENEVDVEQFMKETYWTLTSWKEAFGNSPYDIIGKWFIIVDDRLYLED